MVWILVLLLLLVLVIGGITSVLHGTVSLARYDGAAKTVALPSLPWLLQPADELIGLPGWVLIVGIPFTRRMHLWIRCPGRPAGDGMLRRAGRRYVSGIWVTHDPDGRQEELPGGADLGAAGY